MLMEIQSDVFKCSNIKNGKIKFHKGLNTIIGYNNSVGKSLLLYAIDFAYGGEDYPKIDKAMIKKVKHHTIYFTHNFNGINRKFSRSTDNPDIILEYKEDKIEPWEKQDFNKLLSSQLINNETLLSFRELVGPFSRINLKEANQPTQPMLYYTSQKQSNQVEILLKMYNIYEEYTNYKIDVQDRKKDLSNFTGARELKLVEIIDKNKRIEYEEKIKELKRKKDEFKRIYSYGLITLDELQLDDLKELRNQLKILRRQKTVLEARKADIKLDMADLEPSIKENYKELKRFFPNNNFKELDDVIAYAKKLNIITKQEKEETIKDIEENLYLLNDNIKILEDEIKQIIPNKKIPTSIFDDYSKIDAEITAKQNAIKKEKEFENYKIIYKQSEDRYKDKLQQVIPNFVNSFNNLLKLENRFIFPNNTSPILEINPKTIASYNLHTESDIGDSSTTRGLIIFDILALKNTSTPYLLHDGFITNPFVNKNLIKIIKYYILSCDLLHDKQIFLCLEKADSYDSELKDLAYKHKVIELDANEKSLYATWWNKSKN